MQGRWSGGGKKKYSACDLNQSTNGSLPAATAEKKKLQQQPEEEDAQMAEPQQPDDVIEKPQQALYSYVQPGGVHFDPPEVELVSAFLATKIAGVWDLSFGLPRHLQSK